MLCGQWLERSPLPRHRLLYASFGHRYNSFMTWRGRSLFPSGLDSFASYRGWESMDNTFVNWSTPNKTFFHEKTCAHPIEQASFPENKGTFNNDLFGPHDCCSNSGCEAGYKSSFCSSLIPAHHNLPSPQFTNIKAKHSALP